MISVWQMVRGRLVAAVFAGLVIFLARIGVGELSGETVDTLQALANSLVDAVAFAAYALFHQWNTKRKLNKGEVALENLASTTTAGKRLA